MKSVTQSKPGINVPKKYKHELRSSTSKEYAVATVHDYIKAHQNERITFNDISEGTGISYTRVANAMSAGINNGNIVRNIVRSDAKYGEGRTYYYTYSWVDNPEPPAPKPIKIKENPNNGPAITVAKFDLPPYLLKPEAIDGLKDLFLLWIDSVAYDVSLKDGEILGASKFRMFVEKHIADTKKKRNEIMSAYKEGSPNEQN